jgi:hypothetical protein
MSILPRFPGPLGSRAVSVAANARDGLRTAHFLVQDLATADAPVSQGEFSRRAAWLLPPDAPTSLITGFIAQNARIADKVMNWSSGAAAALLAPDRRSLPSPFSRNLMREIAATVGGHGFPATALFNAYFYQAMVQILDRHGRPPFLILESRIDAARRATGSVERPGASDVAFMTRVLIALVRAAPVVEAGSMDPKSVLARTRDLNVSVAAVAGMALLLGAQGKPTAGTDENRFFGIVGALIAPRLATIERLIADNDVRGLEAELAAIQAMY